MKFTLAILIVLCSSNLQAQKLRTLEVDSNGFGGIAPENGETFLADDWSIRIDSVRVSKEIEGVGTQKVWFWFAIQNLFYEAREFHFGIISVSFNGNDYSYQLHPYGISNEGVTEPLQSREFRMFANLPKVALDIPADHKFWLWQRKESGYYTFYVGLKQYPFSSKVTSEDSY